MGLWWRHVSPNIRWESDNITNLFKGKYIMIMLISFRENVIILYKFNLKCSLPKARFYWSVGYILPVSPPHPPKKNKYDRHDIAGKLKKVMINTNNQIHIPCIINTRFKLYHSPMWSYGSEFDSCPLWGVLDTTFCDNVCQWLAVCSSVIISGYPGYLYQ